MIGGCDKSAHTPTGKTQGLSLQEYDDNGAPRFLLNADSVVERADGTKSLHQITLDWQGYQIYASSGDFAMPMLYLNTASLQGNARATFADLTIDLNAKTLTTNQVFELHKDGMHISAQGLFADLNSGNWVFDAPKVHLVQSVMGKRSMD